MEKAMRVFLEKQDISTLVKISRDETFTVGATSLIKNYGIGCTVLNTVVLGDSEVGSEEYLQVINEVIIAKKNLFIFITQSGFDESKVFSGKFIDVWSQSEGDNTRLMLALAYMLKTSEKWRDATLTFKSTVSNEDQRQGVQTHLETFLAESQILAEVEVVFGEEESYQQIVKSSKEADLVFFGVKSDKDGRVSESIYKEMFEGMKDLPNTVFVLKGESTGFKDIFK